MSVDVVCPCCAGKGTIVWGFPCVMPPMQQRIYELVRFAKRPLSGPRIVELVYGDRRDGGPDYAMKSVHVHICQMNRRLKKVGEKITANGKRESYHWEMIDAHP